MIKNYNLGQGLEKLLGQLHQDFPDVEVQVENSIRFYEHHFPNMESGVKRCTIRFRKECIRVPMGKDDTWYLPCFATRPDDPSYKEEKGLAQISQILIASVGDFPLWAAKNDGYQSLK